MRISNPLRTNSHLTKGFSESNLISLSIKTFLLTAFPGPQFLLNYTKKYPMGRLF